MPRVKPRYGLPAGYWVAPFEISRQFRRDLTNIIGPRCKRFYAALESLIADHIAWRDYRVGMPGDARVRAALDELAEKAGALAGLLDHRTGLDWRTRQFVRQAWVLRGNPCIEMIDDCENALMYFRIAIGFAQASLRDKMRKGRPTDLKLQFACNLWGLFEQFRLKPRPGRNERFERFLNCILTELAETTGTRNLHRLVLDAARHSR